MYYYVRNVSMCIDDVYNDHTRSSIMNFIIELDQFNVMVKLEIINVYHGVHHIVCDIFMFDSLSDSSYCDDTITLILFNFYIHFISPSIMIQSIFKTVHSVISLF